MFDGPHLRFGGVNEAVAQKTAKSVFSTKTANNILTSDPDTNNNNITYKWTTSTNSFSSQQTSDITNRGIQFSNSSSGATTLTSEASYSKISNITLEICTNNSSSPIVEVLVGDVSYGTTTLDKSTTPETKNFKPESSPVSGKIQIVLNKNTVATKNSIYIKSVSFTYSDDNDNPDPTTPIDATVTITPDPINVEAGQTADATIETNYDGAITVTSEDNTIADAIYEDNLIVVEGIAKGATNITISGTGSTTYKDFTKIVAVNVTEEKPVDPTTGNVLYYETFGAPSKNTNFDPNSDYLTDKSIETEVSDNTKVKFSGTTPSSRYEGASKEGNILFSNAIDQQQETTTPNYLILKVGDKFKDYENVTLSFGAYCGWSSSKTATLQAYLSKDGGATYGDAIEMVRETATGWYLQSGIKLDDYLENLYIKFENIGNNTNRIDDIKITGTKKTTTEPEAYTLKVGTTGYATLCLDKAYTMPEGLEGAVVTVSDNILTVDYMYTENDVVAAGMPLLIKAAKAGEYTLSYSAEEGTDLKDETMMSGETDAEGMTVGAAGSKFYKLAAPEAGIGFYWGAPDGAAFKNGADKAYLVVPGTVNVQGFRFDGTTTGIAGIAGAAGTDAAIYTLDGRRVSGKADELPRGIYIVGGKKVIK